MTLLDLLTRVNDHIESAVDRHVHRHPTFWIIVTSLLIVAAVVAAWGAVR